MIRIVKLFKTIFSGASIDAMKGSLRRPPDIKGEVSPEKAEKGG
jgi:hypothetical protein